MKFELNDFEFLFNSNFLNFNVLSKYRDSISKKDFLKMCFAKIPLLVHLNISHLFSNDLQLSIRCIIFHLLILFIHFPTEMHLDYYDIFTTTNNAEMNKFVDVS